MRVAVRGQTTLLTPEPTSSACTRRVVFGEACLQVLRTRQIDHASGQTVFGHLLLNEIHTVGGQASGFERKDIRARQAGLQPACFRFLHEA